MKTYSIFKLLGFISLFLLFPLFSFSQTRSIEGIVKDTNGEIIIGAAVVVEGTSNGTITDFDGKFKLDVSLGSKIVVSFVGYKSQKIAISNQSVVNIILEEDTEVLDEVVVVGYGVQKKKLVTGANLNMSGDVIARQNTATAMDALKGIAAGLNIMQTSGTPGGSSKITIRGIGTTGNSSPLYIVDGIVQNNIDYLSPNDIESIDVFKDAASAAIYGNRGANGVIYVTTKTGKKEMKPTVSYDGYYGVQNIINSPNLLNANQYLDIMQESLQNTGASLSFDKYIPTYDKIISGEWTGTNWFEEMKVKNAPIQNHSIGIQGGNRTSMYSIGGAYFDQEGAFGKQSDVYFKRLTFRLNTEHVILTNNDVDYLTIGQHLTYSKIKKNSINAGNIYNNDVRSAIRMHPTMPVYDENGNYTKAYEDWDKYALNPIGIMDYTSKNNDSDNNIATGDFYLIICPIKNLTIKSRLGFNMSWGDNRKYIPQYDLGTVDSGDNPQISQSAWNRYSLTQDNTINYVLKINDKHNFDFMLGNSLEKNVRNVNIGGSNNNFMFDDWNYAYLSNTSTTIDSAMPVMTGMNEYGWGILSYFGRVLYNYKEKWMFSALLRADGSSRFAKGNRWGVFPSVSAGYVITNEPFMENIVLSGLDFLKFRFSWGQLGNESIGDFLYSPTINYTQSAIYSFGNNPGSTLVGAVPTRIPNPNLSWETSEQLDFGIDSYFFNSRLKFSFDWYVKTTKDWLVNTDIPSSNGLSSITINGGNVQNRGVEFVLGWNDSVGKDFSYGATLSISHNKNEVTKVNNSEGIIHGPSKMLYENGPEINRAEVGKPIGYFWGYKTDGIIQNKQEAEEYVGPSGNKYFENQKEGDFRFVDQNKDGVINDLDKVEIGNPNPDCVLGVQLDAEYKGFYVNATFNGAFGHQIAKSYSYYGGNTRSNFTTEIFERWHGEGTSNTFPMLGSDERNFNYFSDFYVEDADYVKLGNLVLGYSFKDILRNSFLNNLKVYVSARNLFTITSYSGLDPEVGSDGGQNLSWATGIDLGLYPSVRTFLIGLSLTF